LKVLIFDFSIIQTTRFGTRVCGWAIGGRSPGVTEPAPGGHDQLVDRSAEATTVW
jgi:hypothetical protein